MMKLTNVLLLILMIGLFACTDDDTEEIDINDPLEDPGEPVIPNPDDESVVFPEGMDLTAEINEDSRVMMQAFYWNVEPAGQWWDIVSSKIDDWSAMGVNRIWLPVATKGASGSFSMGYDPYDYYDFGEYDQKGTVETRFGSREELETLIQTAHENDIDVIADIVLNHNTGGDEEQTNPITDETHFTKFNPASGMFPRTWEDFHPNFTHNGYDEGGLFFGETDFCHDVGNVQNWFWKQDNSIAKYYSEVMGFDGWRFDYVKGFPAWAVRDFVDASGGMWAVSENFDGNTDVVANYVDATEGRTNAFDFPMFYKMEQAFDGGDMMQLSGDMYWKRNPFGSVTFVSNHDTEKDENEGNVITNKSLAYAYMLTHEGYPTLFYLDYEHEVAMSKEQMEKLVLIHNSIAYGGTEILHNDSNEYIAMRTGDMENGEPGLIVYLNVSDSPQSMEVQTSWPSTTIIDYAQNDSSVIETDESGMVTIRVPAKSYTIWAPQSW